ncbi:MAG TPA: HlyD family efflux transporter periplasmic adaptor subunit [Candidatus Lambdaproteobacteria bacterium]|nr:HlyD family efflux transporter periplasmic adaptor subunit [Candidatus Lambdaproteobacteria bacterium]
MWKTIFNLKFWIPVLVLGLGTGITMALLKNKPAARKKPNFQRGTLVEVIEATLSNPQIEVRTHGRVRAAQKVVLSARIGGEVIWISQNLSEGRFFKKDEILLSIGIRQSQSRLKAPFNGVVQVKNVDLGQYVNPGTQLATLLGSDNAEVVIDLPMGRMDWLPQRLPTVLPDNATEQGTGLVSGGNQYQIPAAVSLAGMNTASVWPATVKRYLLELTPRGMMVQLIAEVQDPFRLKNTGLIKIKENSVSGVVKINQFETFKEEITEKPKFSNIPLFLGAFVDVSIPGRQLENVVKIPAQALRDRDTIWIASDTLGQDSAAGRIELRVRRVQIAHIDQDNVFLSGGIKPGERIITSPIKGAANGLKIRIAGNTKELGKQVEEGNKRKWKRQGKRKEGGMNGSWKKRAEQNGAAHKENK